MKRHFHIVGRKVPAFHLMVAVGMVAGLVMGMGSAWAIGFPVWMFPACLGIWLAVMLVASIVEVRITGKENWAYYRQLLLFTGLGIGFLAITGLPMWAGLDVMFAGAGVFTAIGRIGCHHTGCCHGGPCRHGICYGETYRGSGFAQYLLGVPIWPTQLMESVGTGLLTGAGFLGMLGGAESGWAALGYLCGYAVLRFGLEFLRGDTARPIRGGFSEAQWISVGIAMGATVAAWGTSHPAWPWCLGAAAGLVLWMGIAVLRSAKWSRRVRPLLYPKGVAELLELAEDSFARNKASAPEGETARTSSVRVHDTSWGLRISSAPGWMALGPVTMYSFSTAEGDLNKTDAEMVARLLRSVRHQGQPWFLKGGGSGVWHVVFQRSAR